jgi:hypothetical protein
MYADDEDKDFEMGTKRIEDEDSRKAIMNFMFIQMKIC